jgi:ribosomal protein S18 acetylase RimI-like enzyme
MVTARPYQHDGDYVLLRRFLQNLPDMAEEGGNCTIGDLDWWRFTHENPDKMRDVHLWLDDDDQTVIGWVWPEIDTYDCFIDPRHAGMFPELLAWSEARAREQGDQTISVICNDRDEQRKDVLARAGYQPVEFHFVYRGQALTDDLEPAVLPEGFRFRDMRNATEAEIERRVELHRAVWSPSKMTVAKHKAVMGSPTYRPDLDLIVVAPTGDFASYTIVWHDPLNRIGVFEPVGCHPDYRQQGLTRAVMFEGMARLRQLGARKAFVNSLYNSLPANRLYESSGFQTVDRQRKWTTSLA